MDPIPEVLKFGPRKIFGLPTIEGKKNRITGEISLQIPAGPVTIGPKLGFDRGSEFEITHRYQTTGNFWSSKMESGWDIVYWDMKENKRTKGGIPDRLNVAVVVERMGAFTAEVQVTVDTPVMNGIFGFPWSKDRPVTFLPGVTVGGPLRTDKLEELSDEEWMALIPFEEEWEQNFTEDSEKGLREPANDSASDRTLVGDFNQTDIVKH